MKSITATELARNLSRVLDSLAAGSGEIAIERNGREVARLVAGPRHMTAMEAMGDLYRTLPESAAATWEADGRGGAQGRPWKGERIDEEGLRDPWRS